MAEQTKKEPESTVSYGARAIVIFYALGIVAIGAKPLVQDYDSLLKDIKSTTQSFRREVPKIREGGKPGSAEQITQPAVGKKDQILKKATADSKAAEKEESAGSNPKDKSKAAMDHLTPNDRQQLNKLLSDL